MYDDSMIIWKWKFRRYEWEKESSKFESPRAEVIIHPLCSKTRTIKVIQKDNYEGSSERTPDFNDPLGAVIDEKLKTRSDVSIPVDLNYLSSSKGTKEITLTNTLESAENIINPVDEELRNFTPWSVVRQKILDKFASEDIAPLLSGSLCNLSSPSEMNIYNRAALRLEQLEDPTGVKKLSGLSRDEYIRTINELRRKLLVAWENERKIESVQLVVELSRILSSTAAPNFYPIQFVLVTDILDLFGKFVFERLHLKATKERLANGLGPLPDNFSIADVPETTQETTKNWFCKIGDITEILPRLYIETAIIRCLLFLDAQSLSLNLHRLCGLSNSISHPLVASFARAYICRVAMRLIPLDRGPHWKCLNDWLQSSFIQPSDVYIPAMEWVIQCVTYNAVSFDDLCPLWEYCKMADKRPLVLRSFLNVIDPVYLNEHAVQACNIIVSGIDISVQEICIFGRRLLLGKMPESSRRVVLRNMWRLILKVPSLSGFVECLVEWVEFTARYFTLTELGVILDSLIKKLLPEKSYETFYSSLISIIERITTSESSIAELLKLEQFLALINLFRSSPNRFKCSEIILIAFINSHPMNFSTDFQLAYKVLDLCKLLHDSLNASSSDEDERKVAVILEHALNRFDLNHDPERALVFFVDCRATLNNSDFIVTYIVGRVTSLGFSVTHKKETMAHFLRACIANAFITVASLSDPVMNLRLNIQIALLGLTANCLSQADSTVRCCIETLASCHNMSPADYRLLASNFLGFLVVVPDPPNKPPLYFFGGFLNAIARFPWMHEDLEHGRLLIDCIYYLSTLAQADLPYHIWNVESNDVLHGGSTVFQEAIVEKMEIVIGRLEEIHNRKERNVAFLAVELLETVFVLGKVEKLGTLIKELFTIISSSSDMNTRRRKILNELKKKSEVKPALKPIYEEIKQFQ